LELNWKVKVITIQYRILQNSTEMGKLHSSAQNSEEHRKLWSLVMTRSFAGIAHGNASPDYIDMQKPVSVAALTTATVLKHTD